MRRVLPIILSFAVAFCMMPVAAFAEDNNKESLTDTYITLLGDAENEDEEYIEEEDEDEENTEEEAVCKIEEEEYSSIQSAVDAADEGNTITMIDDENTEESIIISKSVTIDADCYEITGNCEDVFLIEGGNVTIKDAEISNSDDEILEDDRCDTCIAVSNEAVLNLEGTELSYDSYKNPFIGIIAEDHSKINITECYLSEDVIDDEDWDEDDDEDWDEDDDEDWDEDDDEDWDEDDDEDWDEDDEDWDEDDDEDWDEDDDEECEMEYLIGIDCRDHSTASISDTDIIINCCTSICCCASGNAKITVADCYFKATNDYDDDYATLTYDIYDRAAVTVDGGKYYGLQGGVCLRSKYAKLTIKEGVFKSIDSYYAAFWNSYYKSGSKNISIASGYTYSKGKSNWRTTKPSSIAFGKKPVSTKLSKVKGGSKKLTAYWSKKGTKVKGYVVQVATNSKFTKGKKTIYVKGGNVGSKTIKGLKKKKNYYVRVATYRYDSNMGYTFLSSWSKAKKVYVK